MSDSPTMPIAEIRQQLGETAVQLSLNDQTQAEAEERKVPREE